MNLGSLNGPQTNVLYKSLLLFRWVLAENCRLPYECVSECLCLKKKKRQKIYAPRIQRVQYNIVWDQRSALLRANTRACQRSFRCCFKYMLQFNLLVRWTAARASRKERKNWGLILITFLFRQNIKFSSHRIIYVIVLHSVATCFAFLFLCRDVNDVKILQEFCWYNVHIDIKPHAVPLEMTVLTSNIFSRLFNKSWWRFLVGRDTRQLVFICWNRLFMDFKC